MGRLMRTYVPERWQTDGEMRWPAGRSQGSSRVYLIRPDTLAMSPVQQQRDRDGRRFDGNNSLLSNRRIPVARGTGQRLFPSITIQCCQSSTTTVLHSTVRIIIKKGIGPWRVARILAPKAVGPRRRRLARLDRTCATRPVQPKRITYCRQNHNDGDGMGSVGNQTASRGTS
jgi:hypothetical protein